MNYHDDCKCCGQRVTAYTAPLNRGLALAFLEFADKRMALGRPIEKHELELSNSQYGNFQKLRYFGLLQHVDGEKAWEFTKLGMEFFLGKTKVLSPAGHMAGVILEEGHLAWMTHNGKRKLVSLEDVLPEEWKNREAFKAEKKDAVA